MKPVKPCKYPGCNKLTADGYCDEHKKIIQNKYDVQRGSSSKRGYNGTFRKARTMQLNNSPLCERCLANGIVRTAQLVHHKDRNPFNNSEDNLESLCVDCHTLEHKDDVFGNRYRGRVKS